MEDDYSTVYTWFDKCGIISNIRTHLRWNLVNALQSRDLSQKLDKSTPKSAKQYVYDLLIAEYLWNHNYVYTLSVLASEAPLLVDFNKHVRQADSENSSDSRQKLESDYVFHALETLGIEPLKPTGQSIINNYAANDLPLLLCIFQCIRTTGNNLYTLSSKDKYNSVKHQQVQTIESNETTLSKTLKFEAAKKKLIQQKDLFNAQLRQKETELKEQTLVMEKQLLMLQEKLEKAEKLIHMYNVKEKQLNENQKQQYLQLAQKESELVTKEKLLSQEATRLEKERNSYRQFEEDMKKLQNELLKVQKETHADRNCNLIMKDAEMQTEFESFVSTRNERNILNQEKQDLSGLVQEQRWRIEQLTAKVLHLSRKLEEIQLKRSSDAEVPISSIRVFHTNTIISESSSTEDILQDAKMRLRRLEEESMKADQYYFNFITNSSR